MRKLTALIVGIGILLSFSYYVLSGSFSPLINWIGPVIGFKLNLMLGLLWLEQGTPLQYISIFVVWAVVGVIVGISSKKYRGVFGTSILLWTVIGIIVAISIGALAVGFLSSSGLGTFIDTLSGLTNVPPTSNIYAIIHEPVISRWFNLVLSLLTGGSLTTLLGSWPKLSTASKLSEIVKIVFPFIIGPLEAFIILVVFGVIGLHLKRLFFGDSSGPKKEKRQKKNKIVAIVVVVGLLASSGAIILDGNINSTGGAAVSYSTPSAELSALSSIVGTVGPNVMGSTVSLTLQSAGNVVNSSGNGQISPPDVGGNSMSPSVSLFPNGTYRGDVAFSLAEKQGSLLNVYGAMNFSNQSSGFFSFPDFKNSEFSLVILQSNINQMVQSFEGSSNSSSSFSTSNLSLSSLTGLVNLVPGYLFVIAYNGSIASTNGYAESAASYMASSLGISGSGNLISINTATLGNLTKAGSSSTGTKSGNGISIYVYAATPDYGKVAQNFSRDLLNQIDGGTVSTLISGAVDSGYLVPGANSLSSSSSVIVYGDLNSELFSTLLNNTSASSLSFLSRGGSFVLDLSEWQHRFYSSSSDSYSASSMFGYSGPLNVSSSDITVIGYGSDPSLSLTNATSLLSGLNATVLTNYPAVAKSLGMYSKNSTRLRLTPIPNGTIFLSNYVTSINTPFPANVSVGVASRQLSWNEVNVTFTVVNEGNQPLNDVNVSIQKFFSDYGRLVERVSNSPSNIYINSIAPGQSASFSCAVILNGTGSYYLPPLSASYSYGGTSFTTQYGSGYWLHAQKPSVAYAVTSSVLTLMSLYAPLKPLIQFHLGPLNIAELVILIIIVVDVYLEYKTFVAWRKGRKIDVESDKTTESQK